MTQAVPGSADGAVFASSPLEFFAKIASSDNPALSYSEEFLWWSSRLAGDTTFNVRVLLELEGPVDLLALDGSIVEIASRHETLRTVFPMERGLIVRRLLAPESARPVVVDLQDVDPAERAAEAWRRVLEESNRSFNVARGPLFRARILRLGAERHLLQFTIHHIVIDGRSVDNLLRELGVLYAARSHGQPSPLAPLPLQYAEHARQVRARFRAGALDAALRYWKGRLAGGPSLLGLPTDTTRRAARYYPGRLIRFELSSDRTTALVRLARDRGTTTFVVLLSVLKVLLSRLSGDSRIVVEAPLGNRRSVEAEAMVGLLVDLVALRTDLDGNPRFSDLLALVRRTTLDALDHAGVPIHLLVAALNAKVDRSHSAICQVMFNLIDMRPRGVHLAALGARQLAMPDPPHSKFDLMLTAHLKETLELQLLYRQDLFSEVRMEEFVRQFQGLVDQVLADPAIPIDRLSLVTPEAGRVWREAATLGSGREPRQHDEADPQWRCAGWTTERFCVPRGSRIGVLPGSSASVVNLARHIALWSDGCLCTAAAGDDDAENGDHVRTADDRMTRNGSLEDGRADDAPAQHALVGHGRDWLKSLDVLYGEPACWRRLPRSLTLPALRYAFFVGDVLVDEDVRRMRAMAPGAAGAYFLDTERLPAPSACFEIPSEPRDLRPVVPIGRGIGGTDLRVLNRSGAPAGVGEFGEIHAGPSPAADDDARALHGLRGTGLAGRLLPDGNIDRLGDDRHWGCVDGYTIRFDEVASVLMRHPGVLDARVRAETDAAGQTMLVADMTVGHDQPWPEADLDALTREALPDFMVPRRVVWIDSPGDGIDSHVARPATNVSRV